MTKPELPASVAIPRRTIDLARVSPGAAPARIYGHDRRGSCCRSEGRYRIFDPSEERVARLASWYSAEHHRLVRFAYVLTRDVDSAEDLVQDAFIKMYSVRDPIEEAGFPAYARRVR